jgi:hypothetical protein
MNKFNVKLMSSAMLIAMMANVLSFAVTPVLGAMNDPEFDAALAWGYKTGLTSYNTEAAFMPLGALSREAGAKFLSAFATEVLSTEVEDTMNCDFSDAAAIDATLADAVATACGQGLLKGSKGKFMPKAVMTKAQFVVALVRGLDGTMDETTSPWYNNYCTWAQDNGITNETNCSALDRPITRYEALLMLYRGNGEEVIVDEGTEEETAEETEEEVVVVGNGEYTVSTSAESPKGTTLPGLAPAHVASFDIEADSAGKLSSITLERLGLGNKDSIKDVTLYINGTIASKTRSFESDGTREFVLTPAITLAAGDVVTVDVVATIGNEAVASNQEFTIAAIEVNGNAVSAVDANKFRVGAVNATEIKIDMDVNNDTVQLGDKGVEIASFEIENKDTDYDVMIDSITLEDDENNIRTNFENFVLEFDGDEVATVESVDGKYLTFTFAKPLMIADGESQDFKVMADAVSGIGEKIKLIIDDVNYVMGHDAKYGYGLAVTLDTPATNGSEITIDAGDVTLEEVNLDIDEMRQDRDDYLLAAFDLTVNAGSDVELDKLVFNSTVLGGGTMAQIFEKIEVSVDGSTEEVDTIGSTLTFDDLALSIPTGKKVRIEVRGDTKSNLSGLVNDTVQLSLNASTISLEDLDENENITDITPSSLTFDKLTIVEPGVKVSKISAQSLDVVAGQKGIELFKFQVETDDSSSIKFKEFMMTGNPATFNKNYVTKIALYKDGSNVEIESWNGSDITNVGTLDLDGFNEIVAASTTQKYVVKIDVTSNNSLTGSISANVSAFEFRDDENDIVTPTGTFPITTRTIVLVGDGDLDVVADTTNSTIKNNQYIVAGSSKNVAAFKVKASDEDVKLEDLAVTFNNAAIFTDTVKKVEIVKADGTVLNTSDEGTVSVGDTSVQINDLNYTVTAGKTEVLYVRLVTNVMGDGLTANYGTPDFTIGLQVVEAEGMSSNSDIFEANVNSPYTVAIVPVRISALALTDYDASNLSSPNQTIGKLVITADSWTNSKQADTEDAELALKTLTLVCATNAGFSGAVNLALRGDSTTIGTGTCAGGVVTFNNIAGTDSILGAGETATFYVDLQGASFVGDSSIALDYKNNANITYSEENSSTIISGLRFTTTNLGSAFADNF